MFDLRYHAASLAAVFLALIVGILLGVAVSHSGFVSSAERKVLNQRITDLQKRLDKAKLDQSEQQALTSYIKTTYPGLVGNRLAGKRIALIFVGPADGQVQASVQSALVDAGATPPLRLRALRVPVDLRTLEAALPRGKAYAQLRGSDHIGDLGQVLGEGLVRGNRARLWDALSEELIEQRTGSDRGRADGVVVVRTAPASSGFNGKFVAGLYTGLASAGEPAVGVETSSGGASVIAAYERRGLSSVDSVDTLTGKLALVFLLDGAEPGSYGMKQTATDGVVPPLYSLPPVTTSSG
jgi:Copper transport outer membrane protein, MctB